MHRRNPYEYMLSGDELDDLLLRLGLRRAESIWRNSTAEGASGSRGVYRRKAMAFVLLDPTVDARVPDDEAVLGVVTVGEDGHRWLVNAAAKASGHRRLGRNFGEAVLTDPHLCGSGDFRYGHSAQVRGLIVGASSQTPDQDLFEASRLAEQFVEAVTSRHRVWEEETTGAEDWLDDEDRPGARFRAMVSFFDTAVPPA
jgi:hypothetical protein